MATNNPMIPVYRLGEFFQLPEGEEREVQRAMFETAVDMTLLDSATDTPWLNLEQWQSVLDHMAE